MSTIIVDVKAELSGEGRTVRDPHASLNSPVQPLNVYHFFRPFLRREGLEIGDRVVVGHESLEANPLVA